MKRYIRVREERSGLDCRIELLDSLAPRAAEVLWSLAAVAGRHRAQHAMWTGPEISCPVMAEHFPQSSPLQEMPLENATSFPVAGDIATVFAPKGKWKGMPDADFFDIGIFYGDGARLFMPMGWIMASVAGRVIMEDMAGLRSACQTIRNNGACELIFRQVA